MTHYQAYDKSSYSFYKLQIQAYLDNIMLKYEEVGKL